MTDVLDHGNGYDALRGSGAVVRITRDVVRVVGPDAHSFLQSLVSQDLDGTAVGETRHALLLQPQGKLTADFLAVRVADDAWHLVAVPGAGEPLHAGLARFKIRVKADLTLDAAVPALAVRGAAAAAVSAAARAHPGLMVVDAEWPGNPGVELLGDEAAVRAALDGAAAIAPIPEAPGSAYEALRVECGVPEQGAELDDTIIAQEAGLDEVAVSFTKGCFVGQELVCRIDSRGHVNRRLRGIVLGDGPEPVRGATVSVGDKVVGAVTSVAHSPRHGVVALAIVRREVEPPAACVVGEGRPGEVRELPL